MGKEIISALEDIGLSEKEAIIYSSLVKFGDLPVNNLVKLTKINRVTVYPVVQSLEKKGFISKFIINKKTYFKAIEPKQIIGLLKQKENKIKSIIPSMEEKRSIGGDTSVEIFKGEKAMSSFLEKLYSGNEKEFWAYGNGDEIKKKMINLSQNTRNIRIAKKIKLNTIINHFYRAYTEPKEYRQLTKVRVNTELSKFNIYVVFSKKVVGIHELTKEFTGIIIQNEEIAKYHKAIYDLYEKGSRKVV